MMDIVDRSTVLGACRAMLRPLASFLMKCGMTWREFADISKSVFVEVAGDDYGIKGRPTNISRIAILSGIDRKEVRRQQELLATAAAPPATKTTDATRVLSGWHQDREFSTADGQSLPIPVDDEQRSFATLCRRYAGDISPSTLLKELKRVGAVEQDSEGNLRAMLRYYMPVAFDAEWILNAGSVLADLGRNVNHNLQAGDDNPSQFMGRATNHAVPVEALPDFREFLEQHGQEFLEKIDPWLTEHSTDDETLSTMRLGVGLFHIQDAATVRG